MYLAVLSDKESVEKMDLQPYYTLTLAFGNRTKTRFGVVITETKHSFESKC